MKRAFTRALLACASLIFAAGGVLHAIAFFAKAASIIESSGVKAFFGLELKVLWLADSTTLASMALLCAYAALRPSNVQKPMLCLLAFVPGSTTVLLYGFLGPFYAAHLLLLGTAMLLVAALTLHERGAQPLESTRVAP
jgi:hypothetical protein